MSEIRTVHVRIEGRVQGVSFRAWTEYTARELGLTGWVRNRRDRSVEAVFQGPSEQVAKMLDICTVGPQGAEVTNVEIIGEDDGEYCHFEIKPTL